MQAEELAPTKWLPQNTSHESLACLAMATQNQADDVEGKRALQARGVSGEENSEAQDRMHRRTNFERRGRVRELPLGINPREQ